MLRQLNGLMMLGWLWLLPLGALCSCDLSSMGIYTHRLHTRNGRPSAVQLLRAHCNEPHCQCPEPHEKAIHGLGMRCGLGMTRKLQFFELNSGVGLMNRILEAQKCDCAIQLKERENYNYSAQKCAWVLPSPHLSIFLSKNKA